MWMKTDVVVIISSFLVVWISTCDSLPLAGQTANSPPSVINTQQWQSLVRDALKYLQKQSQHKEDSSVNHKPKIRFVVDQSSYSGGGGGSGGVGARDGVMKHRNIRSGLGDMANAFRLYQLHELEKEWASKARPRFGKRAEVTQDNFLPAYASYADDDYEDPTAGGDAKVPSASREQFAQENGDRFKGKGRFQDEYSIL